MKQRVYCGQAYNVLKTLPSNSVDAVVTDPPYGISFMGKKWDYHVPGVILWSEVLRVLKPGGHALIACGTRTQHRMAVNIEDAGFEIRDVITWLYGSGFPKSHNGDWGGTALKPACEFWTLARKPLEGTVAKNFEKHGTGGLNIDGCRVGFLSEDDERESKAKNQHDDFNSGPMTNQVFGKYKKPRENYNPPGRFPANLILDEEAAMALDEQSGHLAGAGNKKPSPVGKGTFGMGERLQDGKSFGDSGGASRFFYVAKASKSERNAGLEGMPLVKSGSLGTGEGGGPTLTGSGNERTNLNQNHHPTVKPIKLMRYLCRLITPPGGTVLDPFLGSGSTLVAAKLEGFSGIGIEREKEYYEIAKARISKAKH